jgi:hypothetical protein
MTALSLQPSVGVFATAFRTMAVATRFIAVYFMLASVTLSGITAKNPGSAIHDIDHSPRMTGHHMISKLGNIRTAEATEDIRDFQHDSQKAYKFAMIESMASLTESTDSSVK